jgi:apolipoprotein N-acyltransferase
MLGATGLYERTMLIRTVPVYSIPTLYSRFGDWFVGMCAALAAIFVAGAIIKRKQ